MSKKGNRRGRSTSPRPGAQSSGGNAPMNGSRRQPPGSRPARPASSGAPRGGGDPAPPGPVETPDVETPDVETPDVETPDVETRDVETPDVETPNSVDLMLAEPTSEPPDRPRPGDTAGAAATPPLVRLGSAERRQRSSVQSVVAGVATGAVLGAAAALAASQLAPDEYTSEALAVVVSANATTDASPAITAVFAEVGGSETVLRGAAETLGVAEVDLDAGLVVSQTAAAPLVSVRMTTEDPALAAQWANAVADELIALSAEDQVPGFSLTRVTPAVSATEPDAGLGLPVIAAAAVLGGVLTGGLVQYRAHRRA